MAQILLIHPSGPIAGIIKLTLSQKLQCEVIHKTSASLAVQHLELSDSVELIITSIKSYQEETAQDISSFIKTKGLSCSLLTLGEFNNKYISIKDPSDYEEVSKIASDLLGAPELENEEFLKVPADNLLSFNNVPVDLYIKVQENFIKRYHHDDNYSHKEIIKYIDNGLTFFWIKKENSEQLYNFFKDRLLKDNESEGPLKNEYFDLSKTLLINCGISHLPDETVSSIMNSLEGQVLKEDFVINLLEQKSSRFYKLTSLISLLSAAILEKLSFESSEEKYLLTFCAFFHDITLNEDAMFLIRDEKTLEKSKLVTYKKEVIEHAKNAANLVASIKNSPKDAVQLILRHHGKDNGIGFSSKLPNQATQCEIIFRICEEFSIEIIKAHESNSMIKKPDIIALLLMKYPDENAVKVTNLLKEIIQ